MLQPFAVSTIVEKPNGVVEHALYVIEANSVDDAEGRVLAQSLSGGRSIRGLLSRSIAFDNAPLLIDLS